MPITPTVGAVLRFTWTDFAERRIWGLVPEGAVVHIDIDEDTTPDRGRYGLFLGFEEKAGLDEVATRASRIEVIGSNPIDIRKIVGYLRETINALDTEKVSQ
jgi:hypothetical protein